MIVGGGFGGLDAAQALATANVHITVIDRKNYHTFQPLLYQVATAGLSPGEIAAPIRSILRLDRNIEVLMAEVTGFDLDRRTVETPDGEIPYDYLIVAAGASHAYFGHDEWEPYAPGLKTIEDALEIRRRVLLAFELAEHHTAAGEAAPPLNFVVVGGGPTGVELAGTLAEISRHALAHEFRSIDPKMAHILLLEGGPRILPSLRRRFFAQRAATTRASGRRGADFDHGHASRAGAVYIGPHASFRRSDLWAAGVAASSLGKSLGAPVDRAGRVLVQPDLTLPGHPDVFVIGDLPRSKIKTENFPRRRPRRHARRPLRRKNNPPRTRSGTSTGAPSFSRSSLREGRGLDFPVPAFHYRDKGSLATIGRAAAIAEFGTIHISGFIAWLAWLFIHILFLSDSATGCWSSFNGRGPM